MPFNTLTFVLFLAGFILVYFITRGKLRLWACLLASNYFYAAWDWRFLGLLWLVILLSFFSGKFLHQSAQKGRRKAVFLSSLVIHLAILGGFKYFNFFIQAAAKLLGQTALGLDENTLQIILPIGLSFYIFQSLSYLIDLYREEIEAEVSLLRFATYLSFFPQLVLGPILRARQFLPQLQTDRKPTWEGVLLGLHLIAWGFFLKTVVADSMEMVVYPRFGNPYMHSSLSLMFGVFCYSFQIYGDLCGYTCIAIGIGCLLGFDFGRAFDRPLFATSIREFWRRWYISLSTWFRDYVYIPLGGDRKGRPRTCFNLVLTMFLSGLWHAASLKMIIWGLLHGFYLAGERLLSPFYRRFVKACHIPVCCSNTFLMGLVFLLTTFAWIFFRSENFVLAKDMIIRIFGFDDLSFASLRYKFRAMKALFILAMLLPIEWLSLRVDYHALARKHPVLYIPAIAFCLYCIFFLGSFSSKPFLYFAY